VIVAVTGHRDPRRWPRDWAQAWRGWFARDGVVEARFGGALGFDTEALRQAAAWRAGRIAHVGSVAKGYDKSPAPWAGLRLAVYVPGRAADQPSEAHRAINDCLDVELGDRLVELGLVKPGDGTAAWAEALMRRNTAMLVDGRRDGAGKLVVGAPADVVFACWDGERRGGTFDTITKARERGIPVVGPGLDGSTPSRRAA
jgi:hypothetical protein